MSETNEDVDDRHLGGYGPSPLIVMPKQISKLIADALHQLRDSRAKVEARMLVNSLDNAAYLGDVSFERGGSSSMFHKLVIQTTRKIQELARREPPETQMRIDALLELARSELTRVQKIAESITSVHRLIEEHLSYLDEVLEYDHEMEDAYFELRALLNSYYHEPTEPRLSAYLRKARHFRSHFELINSKSPTPNQSLSGELEVLRGFEDRILAAELLESEEGEG